MKKVVDILDKMAELINKGVVLIFLLLIYVVMCLYRLFLKPNDKRWQTRKEGYHNELEQTKHLW